MARRSLEDFILSYRRLDASGTEYTVVTVEDYHLKYIQPLDSSFSRWNFYNSSKVLCCFKDHDDINPSLGTIPDKKHKNVRIYHCMGCGATGTVIRLHQRIQREYHNRRITDRESALELAKLYNIDVREYEEIDSDQATYIESYRNIQYLLDVYTIREYSSELLDCRKMFAKSSSIAKMQSSLNSANVKMIATKKDWVD